MKKYIILSLFLMLLSSSANAGEDKITGYAMGDIYYVGTNNNEDLEGLNGMRLKRVYLGYDYKVNDEWATRITLEMNDQGFRQASGDFLPQSNMTPFVKDVYLQWTPARPYSMYLGISPSPTWEIIEKFWGYRAVEKTVLDLHGLGSSRDTGIALKGSFDADKRFGYHFMLGNGGGTRNEDHNNGDKKVMLSLYAKPIKPLILEIYGDYENNRGYQNETESVTYQAFAGLEGEKGRIAIQASQVVRSQGEDSDDKKVTAYSLFGSLKLKDNMTLLGRIDMVDDPDALAGGDGYVPMSKDEDKILVLAGLDYEVTKGINFIPNVEWITYSDDNDSDLDDDLYAKLTINFKWQ